MDKRAAARTAYERYVSTEGPRVDEFRRIVASRGGPSEAVLDLSRDSLGALGAWLLGPIPPGPEDDQHPVWAWDRSADDPYLKGSWLPDGLGTYLVAMLRRRHPELTWKLEGDRRSIYAGLPVLVGLGPVETLPYTAALGSLEQATKASPPDPDWLINRFDVWSALVTQTATDPGESDPTTD